ncbi:hypothetical protein D3C78_1437880 [compost metagenome]
MPGALAGQGCHLVGENVRLLGGGNHLHHLARQLGEQFQQTGPIMQRPVMMLIGGEPVAIVAVSIQRVGHHPGEGRGEYLAAIGFE